MTTPSELMKLCDELIFSHTVVHGDPDIIAVARALKERLEADRWLPIEQAPRDGTRFVALWDKNQYEVMSFIFAEDAFVTSEGHRLHPTHFRPLPSPPADGQKGDER